MTKDDGGPAFPAKYGPGDYKGMTLRDWFAGQALAGLMAAFAIATEDPVEAEAERARKARACYRLADVMIAARAQS